MKQYFPPNFFDQFLLANGSKQLCAEASAIVKESPSDFIVREELGFDLEGSGEHFWLYVEKTQRHTVDVAKQLANHFGLLAKNVGFSGMKDHQAVTKQWFSLWMPEKTNDVALDFSGFDDPSIRIIQQTKHTKKLKRGVHQKNHFELMLREFQGDKEQLSDTIKRIQTHGVPNYFGQQRFGYEGSNLNKAFDWFEKGYKIKQQNKRSLLLSSARSFLFNTVLSNRISSGEWLQANIGDGMNLEGSQSVFKCDDVEECTQRINSGDVHTTGVLWGRDGKDDSVINAITSFERDVLYNHEVFRNGLEQAGLNAERRALRFIPKSLQFYFEGDILYLKFSLLKGHYATMLLRELIDTK